MIKYISYLCDFTFVQNVSTIAYVYISCLIITCLFLLEIAINTSFSLIIICILFILFKFRFSPPSYWRAHTGRSLIRMREAVVGDGARDKKGKREKEVGDEDEKERERTAIAELFMWEKKTVYSFQTSSSTSFSPPRLVE